MSGSGVLSRWSRRKAGLDAAPEASTPAAAAVERVASIGAVTTDASVVGTAPASLDPVAPKPIAAEPVLALPSMADVAVLTRESDYSRFVMTDIDPAVRNAAMKKLFSDPHFNIMDGLDTYIGDYSQPDPIPLSMLRSMNQAISLGLFDDDEVDESVTNAPATSLACPDGEALAPLAQSPSGPPHPELRHDDDADLRLQQDDAPRRPGAGPGTRA
jgi:hypothetical protein